jgi:hypothetical protein
MADKHDALESVPVAIEAVAMRIDELVNVFGPAARPLLASVGDGLRRAMASRDRGDRPQALREIGAAMDRLAQLADSLDPAEATMMRAVAHSFRTALGRGDDAQAKQDAAAMFERSGAVEKKKS